MNKDKAMNVLRNAGLIEKSGTLYNRKICHEV